MPRGFLAVPLVLLVPALLSAQVPAGGEFIVTGDGGASSLAANLGGGFVVAFQGAGDESYGGVSARRYDASGAPLGPEFPVNTYTTGCQGNAYGQDVASDSAGNFVVVWESFGCWNLPPQDGSGPGIYAQRYDDSGTARGAEFRVNAYTTGAQHRPVVASDAAGNFVAVWASQGQDGPGWAIFGQRFDASGAPRGAEFQVDANTGTDRMNADVASDAAGGFVVAWERRDLNGNPLGLFGRRYDASGSPAGVEFRVDTAARDRAIAASVAMDASGGFVVSWINWLPASDCCLVLARRFDRQGVPQGGEIEVTTSWAGQASSAADATGAFVVSWTRNVPSDPDVSYVMARRYDASGAPRGAEFRVSDYYGHLSAAAVDPSGNFVVSWTAIEGVVGQRFGGLVPAPSVVDPVYSAGSDGNGVLEPGESVEVITSWRNVNGAAQAFDGQASTFGGPPAAGVGYWLQDGTGAYGTVPDGATAACIDCYRAGVTFGGTRPSTHWDATLTERLTPDVLGQARPWPLHVGDSFTDVPRTSVFYRFVETLLHRGVTGGCSAGDYCPADPVTREQVAVFTLLGKHGSGYLPAACATPLFGDVPASSPYCRFIEELSRRGVVSGCGSGNYCPARPVARGEMAVFVLRTLDPGLVPPACMPPNMFGDVPESSPYCSWIEELARRGVVGGCGNGNYCPDGSVTREQMAVFITLTFGLILYGP